MPAEIFDNDKIVLTDKNRKDLFKSNEDNQISEDSGSCDPLDEHSANKISSTESLEEIEETRNNIIESNYMVESYNENTYILWNENEKLIKKENNKNEDGNS
jgi:hypothetical protein